MAGTKAINNRKRRETALRELLGDDVYRDNRASLDNAEAVREGARFLRQMREHAGLKQSALARKLGVSQARISEIERGNSPEGVSYALLKRMAAACGFPDWPAAPVGGREIETADPAVLSAFAERPIEFQLMETSKSLEYAVKAVVESLKAHAIHSNRAGSMEVRGKDVVILSEAEDVVRGVLGHMTLPKSR
jgi:transcriptional regulator with XRE-family HTH domain